MSTEVGGGDWSGAGTHAVTGAYPDVIVLGRIGMDLYPQQVGPLRDVRSFAHAVGGSAANVAVACARLGCTAMLVSGVGNDRVGRYLLGELDRYGVDSTYVVVHPTLKTPVVIAELDPPEDPGLEFYRWPSAPDLEVSEAVLPRDNVEHAKLAWVTGTGLSAEPSRSATLAAMRWRSERGATTVFDLDWRPALWNTPADATAAYGSALSFADVLVGNRDEIAVALGIEAEPTLDWAGAAARQLLGGHARCVIVKLGADGVLLADADGTMVVVPPLRVEVVCGLGAGDAFGGSVCHSLLHNDSLEAMGRRANAAGALVASQLLCSEAMPTLEELRDFVQSHDPGAVI
jgi:5-dehydro-2-deoxygluconokinase